jgi:hypothetical protein
LKTGQRLVKRLFDRHQFANKRALPVFSRLRNHLVNIDLGPEACPTLEA